MFVLRQSSDGESWETLMKNEDLNVVKKEKMEFNHLAALANVDLEIIEQDEHGARIIFSSRLYE